jgi:7-keto-8-aminopelargonate synthetase-like enzyme
MDDIGHSFLSMHQLIHSGLPSCEKLLHVQIDKIDIITAGMGNALATDGGFCTGSVRVVDHQVCAIPDRWNIS